MDEERFRRLARSSPWLWRSLRLTWDGEDEPVRAWVRRPQAIRVESLDGRLLMAQPGRPAPTNVSLFYVGAPGPDVQPAPPVPIWWTDPSAPAPPRGADGLVTDPVDLPMTIQVDDPMWVNYRWVAALNPHELADGSSDEAPRKAGPAVDIDDLSEGVRHGRATVWATVHPRDTYDPRCSCCPLLPSRVAALAEGFPDPDGPFAEAHRVALDVATGVCVSAREIGGPTPGRGFDVVIEAVDEAIPDEWFARHTRRPTRWASIRGRLRPRPGLAPPDE